MRKQLERAVRRVCPRWLSNQADDIVQRAVMRVLAILRQGEGAAPPSASYLWKVAYTATVDEIRRSRRQREVPLGEDQSEPVTRAAGDDPASQITRREIGEAIRDCLLRLVEARRAAVTLYLHGHTVPEAAALLRSEAKRIENLVYRGLADLRRCLSAKGLEP